MRITLNGDVIDVPANATVRNVVEMMTERPNARGVAVAVNAEVVHRAEWDATTLSEEDQVEVLSAIGGG